MTTNKLPAWLQSDNQLELPNSKYTWFGADYLEKTLRSIHQALAENEQVLGTQGNHCLLQQLEPHIKFVGIILLILSSAVTKSITFLVILNILIAGAALQTGICFRNYAIRVWLPTFIFTGIAVLPGIINWVTPGDAIYTVYADMHWKIGRLFLPTDLMITKQGLRAALFVIFRSAASLGLMTLLIKTTRWSLITKVMTRLGLSTIMVTVLDMTYRYIYLFLLLFMEYIMGRKSRLVGTETQSEKISWIGRTIADFLRITKDYSQEIQYAMQSRGYSGEYYVEPTIKIRIIDLCFLVAVIFICYYAYGGINDVWLSCLSS